MLTILSALGGLATSLLPDVIHGWLGARQEAADRAQELAILQQQVELEKIKSAEERIKGEQRLAEINIQADIAESAALEKRVAVVGVTWVDALNASVRPVVTYTFFLLFTFHMAMQVAAAAGWIGESTRVAAIAGAWSDEVQALFAGIMGFWFGNRSMQHARKA